MEGASIVEGFERLEGGESQGFQAGAWIEVFRIQDKYEEGV